MKSNYIVILLIFIVSCSKVEPRRPINPKPSSTIFKETIKESKQLNKVEDDRILKIIEKDSIRKYQLSPSGFWYTYLKKVEGNFDTPSKGDKITLTYNIATLDDQILYSEEELGQKKYVVDEEDFITALQKGVKLMKVGEKVTFVIPSYNAFGLAGDGNKIGINQSIKSTVTLINIKK